MARTIFWALIYWLNFDVKMLITFSNIFIIKKQLLRINIVQLKLYWCSEIDGYLIDGY